MTKYYYFADYEVLMGDRYRTDGQTTLTYAVNQPEDFDPRVLLARIQQQAADAHGVAKSEVRIRTLNRL